MPSRSTTLDLLKPLLDRTAAFVALIVLAPLAVLTALVVRVTLGSPVLFCQTRTGLSGRLFTLYKFRTMIDDRDRDGRLRSDEERLRPIGRVLRSLSLDELPQFVNILRGDMSLVGPRPLLPEYLPRYSAHHGRRHEVKPGLTGWAQVSGRAALSWDEKLDLDVWYVDHRSLWLDARILLQTIWMVLSRQSTSGAGNVAFQGSGRDRTAQHPEGATRGMDV